MSKVRLMTLVSLAAVLSMLVGACAPLAAAPTAPAPKNTAPVPAQPTTKAAPATAASGGASAGATGQTTTANKGLVPTPPADSSRPLAKVPAAQRADAFSGPAPMSIDPQKHYVATIITGKGNIVAELYGDTPQSTNNFVTLSKDGFYDGLTFHRVEPGFVIQGGDPLGTGTGGPGYTVPGEFPHKHVLGALAFARQGDQVNPTRASSGSQFYITLAPTPQLDGAYTVFGAVIQGMDVAQKIAVGDVIKEIDISEAATSQLPTAAPPTPTREPVAPKPQDGRPLAKLPVEQRENLYTLPPAMTIDTGKAYQATISTAKGNVVLDLDPKAAPNAVNSFVVLANLGYYDGMPVAFVQPDTFVVLGSPNSREDSDVGYAIDPEPQPGGTKVITGTVTLYPSQDPTNGTVRASGSQLLLWMAAAPDVNVPLSVFAKVSSGQDVVARLAAGDKIDKIEITVR